MVDIVVTSVWGYICGCGWQTLFVDDVQKHHDPLCSRLCEKTFGGHWGPVANMPVRWPDDRIALPQHQTTPL